MQKQQKQSSKWSQRQNLIYEIYILLQWAKNYLKKQKRNRFKELQRWLGGKKSASQCYNHHKKKLRGLRGRNEEHLIRNIIKSNYTQRELAIDHILIQARGHLKEILDQDQKQELKDMTEALIAKWQSLSQTKTLTFKNEVNKQDLSELQQMVCKQNKQQQILAVSPQNQNPFLEPVSLTERDQTSEYVDQQWFNNVLFTWSVQNN